MQHAVTRLIHYLPGTEKLLLQHAVIDPSARKKHPIDIVGIQQY